MCIFSGEVHQVANTKIFVSIAYPAKVEIKNNRMKKIVNGKPLQLTVYSNNVQTQNFDDEKKKEVAMVLPFPLIKGSNRVKILDMSNYSNFFDDLNLMFPTLSENSLSIDRMEESNEQLEVHHIGQYKASMVPNFSKFDLLQYDEFNLTPDVKQLLKQYYHRGYGFMVCIIDTHNSRAKQYHPFAYVHELRADKHLFVPTRHYHKSTILNSYSRYHTENPTLAPEDAEIDRYFLDTLMLEDRYLQLTSRRHESKAAVKEKEEIDWDHEIYVNNFSRVKKNPLLDKPGVQIFPADLTKLIRFYTYVEPDRLPRPIILDKPISLFKVKITAPFRNNFDLLI